MAGTDNDKMPLKDLSNAIGNHMQTRPWLIAVIPKRNPSFELIASGKQISHECVKTKMFGRLTS